MRSEPAFKISTCREDWKGMSGITNLIVFGDSTTRFGNCTTWLGHFLQSVNSKRNNAAAPQLKASCYAVPGNTVVDHLEDQIGKFFSQFPKKGNPQATPSLDPSATLYVFWLGTNDCGATDDDDLADIVDTLFGEGLHELYVRAGARNFLIIDVPPKDRSPSASNIDFDLSDRYKIWNEALYSNAKAFASETEQASIFLFSSYDVVTEVLDDPTEFDFQEEDATTECAGIWLDGLHLTSEVHAILAERLENTLRRV